MGKNLNTHDQYIRNIREIVEKMIKDSPQPIKRNGVTIINQNGKRYVYNLISGKKSKK